VHKDYYQIFFDNSTSTTPGIMNRLCLFTLAITLLFLSAVWGASKPGIIRPVPDSNGNVYLKIPQGGAIIKPQVPVNNTEAVTLTFIILGQACDLNDPLIFYYDVLDTNGADAILSFPADFFYLHACCGGRASSLNLLDLGNFSIHTTWNGNTFTDDIVPGCCPE
jgi:hypothetical protein